MTPQALRAALAALAILAANAPAFAAVAVSPDDVCPPLADPCVISTVVEVDSDFPLDFGLRTVRIAAGGELRGSVDLLCGAFETDGPGLWLKLLPNDAPAFATITARRACSGNASLPCLDDTVCSDASAGTCSVGDGGIRVAGRVEGSAPFVHLRAAGDVTLDGNIDASGHAPRYDGGGITVESLLGSIESSAELEVDAVVEPGEYNDRGFAGAVVLRAAVDITLRGPIRATGGSADVELDAGRDIAISSSILTQGLGNGPWIGGTIDLASGGDLRIVREPDGGNAKIDISGGHEAYQGYGGTGGAPGGYGFLDAGGDLVVGDRVRMRGDGGRSSGMVDDQSFAGDWYFECDEDLSFDARLTSRGRGLFGIAFHGVSFEAGGTIDIGAKAKIKTTAFGASNVMIQGLEGESIVIDGLINARSRPQRYAGYGEGRGGYVTVYGGDVSVGGKIDTGSSGYGGGIIFDVCRLNLKSGGSLDASKGPQDEGSGYVAMTIHENLVAEPGSRILSKEDSPARIDYRDAAKPPLLGGKVSPAPELTLRPLLSGCPVCGNSEIDEDETCDDGNAAGGDGCSAGCLTEP
jgi:cysteine-rich repeat protein